MTIYHNILQCAIYILIFPLNCIILYCSDKYCNISICCNIASSLICDKLQQYKLLSLVKLFSCLQPIVSFVWCQGRFKASLGGSRIFWGRELNPVVDLWSRRSGQCCLTSRSYRWFGFEVSKSKFGVHLMDF